MIIGHGDIASAIIDRYDRLYFASGVSNSGETRKSEYEREIDLLKGQDHNKHLVYFSSLCIFYSNTMYAMHKRAMESLVRILFPEYTIVRLGNITWGTNPHTLINFLRNRIRTRQPLEIKDVYRFIVEMDEFRYWLDLIPDWSCEMNITGRRMKVRDIVKEYAYPWLPGKEKDGESQRYHTQP